MLSQCGGDSSGVSGSGTGGTGGTGVSGSTSITVITAGFDHTCALQGGQALCWGLGNGALATRPFPVMVRAVEGASGSMLSEVTAFAAGDGHSCALQDGEVLCWGKGDFGQMGDGDRATRTDGPVRVSTP